VYPKCGRQFMQYLAQNPAANRAYQKIGCPRPIDTTLAFTEDIIVPRPKNKTLSRMRLLYTLVTMYNPGYLIINDVELLRVMKPFSLRGDYSDYNQQMNTEEDPAFSLYDPNPVIVAAVRDDNPYSFYDILNRSNVSHFSFGVNEPLQGIATYLQAAEECLPTTVCSTVNVEYDDCRCDFCDACDCLIRKVKDIFATTNTDYVCIVEKDGILDANRLEFILGELKNSGINMSRLGFSFKMDWTNNSMELDLLIQTALRFGVTRFNTNCVPGAPFGFGLGISYPLYYGSLVRHLKTLE